MKTKKTFFYIFFIFFLIYWIGSFSKVTFGDCLGFVLDVEQNKFQTVATPLSHFLYSNFVLLLYQITPFNSIESSKLFVVLSSSTAISIFYLIVLEFTNKNWIAIATTFVLGFSFTFWRNSENVEVYTFYLIWIALFLLNSIKYWHTKKPLNLLLASLFYGLSFWAHFMSITILPGFLLLLYLSQSKIQIKFLSFGIFLFFFLSLFILNFTQGLPLNSVYSSGNFNWVSNSFSKTPLQYSKDLLKALIYLFYNFTLFTFFGIFGCYQLFKNDQKLFWILSISAAGNFGFATIYAVSDNYVFFVLFNVIFSLLIGYGILKFSWKKKKKLSPVVLLIPLFYFASYTLAMKTDPGIEFNSFKAYKGGAKYYLLPWLVDNVGIIEITIENKKTSENIDWMKKVAQEYIILKKFKGVPIDEIKKH